VEPPEVESRMFGSRLRAALANLSGLIFHDGAVLIPLAALIACLPRVVRGISCGHDFDFHLDSWLEVQRAWSQGVLYPHWAQSPDWGAGEPRFIFYPPISWILGALLGSSRHWRWVPLAFTWICLACTGLSTRALARRFLPGNTATLAGVIATSALYALFTAYERSAFSELAAAALIPLLLLYALDPGSSPLVRGPQLTVRCSLTLAAIWLTNAPAGVMASYLLAYTAVAAALILRSWKPIIRAAVAAPLALGLAAFYLIPAEWEQRWIAISQVIDVGMRITDSWLFAHHPGPDMELHDHVLRTASMILVFTVSSAVIAFLISLRKGVLPKATRSWWMPLALLIPILLLIQFPVSALLWKLPKLEFLQFPWRWLIVLDVPFAIFVAAAIPLSTRRSRIIAGIGVIASLLLCATISSSVFFQFCDEEDNVSNQLSVIRNGTGVEGTDEYSPSGADNSLVASNLPDACMVSNPLQKLGESDSGSEPDWYPEQGSCDDTFTAQLWQNEHRLLQIDSDHDGFIVLRLRRYPAWRIAINGQPAANAAAREDGLLVLPVRAGPSTIDIRWSTTPDALWGRRTSLLSLAILLTLTASGAVRRRSLNQQRT